MRILNWHRTFLISLPHSCTTLRDVYSTCEGWLVFRYILLDADFRVWALHQYGITYLGNSMSRSAQDFWYKIWRAGRSAKQEDYTITDLQEQDIGAGSEDGRRRSGGGSQDGSGRDRSDEPEGDTVERSSWAECISVCVICPKQNKNILFRTKNLSFFVLNRFHDIIRSFWACFFFVMK